MFGMGTELANLGFILVEQNLRVVSMGPSKTELYYQEEKAANSTLLQI